jgi:hypothetical protein
MYTHHKTQNTFIKIGIEFNPDIIKRKVTKYTLENLKVFVYSDDVYSSYVLERFMRMIFFFIYGKAYIFLYISMNI